MHEFRCVLFDMSTSNLPAAWSSSNSKSSSKVEYQCTYSVHRAAQSSTLGRSACHFTSTTPAPLERRRKPASLATAATWNKSSTTRNKTSTTWVEEPSTQSVDQDQYHLEQDQHHLQLHTERESAIPQLLDLAELHQQGNDDDLDLEYTLSDIDDRRGSNERASSSNLAAADVLQLAVSRRAQQQQGSAAEDSPRREHSSNDYSDSYSRNIRGSTSSSYNNSSSSSQSSTNPRLQQAHYNSSNNKNNNSSNNNSNNNNNSRRQHHEYQTPSSQGPIDAPLLTAFLNKCSSLEELYGLFCRHHHRFNHFHVSCAMNRLAWLGVGAVFVCVCVCLCVSE